MNPAARLEALRRHNPFTSASVGAPGEGPAYPHVAAINHRALQGLCHLINYKSAQPTLNCAGLVLGEVGSGKTHLLERLFTDRQQTSAPFFFAYIQPLEDPQQPFRYLMREVVVHLCRPLGATVLATPLGSLATQVVRIGSRGASLQSGSSIAAASFEQIRRQAVEHFLALDPAMSAAFLKVLCTYVVRQKRTAALEWLKGEVLDATDTVTLGVPDRQQASVASREQEAREILISIGSLLARYRRPLVLCFDRLENLDSADHVHAFGKLVEFLVDKAPAMLPIICVRGQQWERTLRTQLNQHVSSRLEANTFELSGCTAEQALAIVQCRLAWVPEQQLADPIFPFDRDELLRLFSSGLHSPRTVIMLSNQRLQQLLQAEAAPPLSPRQRLQEAYTQQYQSIVEDFERFPPDRARLRRGLEWYVRGRFSNLTLSAPEPTKYVDMVGTLTPSGGDPITVTFLIDVERHNAAVRACFSQATTALQDTPASVAVYIRDARCALPALPRWPTTNAQMQTFKKLGGHLIVLDAAAAAAWYALALLGYAVREGDITVMHTHNTFRPVSLDEFGDFIRHDLPDLSATAFTDIEAIIVRLQG